MGNLKISKKRFCQDLIEEYSRVKRFLEYSTLENYDENFIKQFFSSTLLNRFLIPERKIELTTLRFGGVYSRIKILEKEVTIELSTMDFIFSLNDMEDSSPEISIELNNGNPFSPSSGMGNVFNSTLNGEIYSHSDSEFVETIEILSGEYFKEEELEVLGPCKATFSRILNSIEKHFGM